MVYYPAYLDSKQDIVDFCNIQYPSMNTGTIKDVDVRFADTAIFSYLYKNGRIKGSYAGTVSGSVATPLDKLSFLWAASMAYNCEFLSYRGVISFNVGGIAQSKIGDVETKFMQMQPMFFMGNNPSNMDPVMPFRSFKQIAQGFLDSYIDMYHQDSGTQGFRPQSAWDATSRGFGFNAPDDTYRQVYDDELTGT